MSNITRSIVSWIRSQSDVTQVCLAMSIASFVVGALLLIANLLVPLGPRGAGLIAVGCFYLCHGIAEGLRNRRKAGRRATGDGIWPWERRRHEPFTDSTGEASGSLAA
jgi:hypothetical protein